MKKSIIVLCSSLILFFGIIIGNVFGILGKQNILSLSTKTKVFVDKSELTENLSAKQILLNKAEKSAAKEILTSWSKKRFLFIEEDISPYSNNFSNFLVIKKDFTPKFDEMSSTYEQLFSIKMELLPCSQVKGKIIHIEGNKSLAAANYYITIKLNGLVPDSNGAYFVIGRPKKFHKKEKIKFFTLVGGGKIYRTVNSTAQGIIMVSAQEISMDDIIFLVKTHILPVVKKKKEKKVEEVIVEPEIIKKEKETPTPAESK